MMNDWGAPESAVLARAHAHLETNRDAVIATLINVDGSAYRRPGAKLVVADNGGAIGAITSGCLADEITRLVESVMETEIPRVESFDLSADSDGIGLGIGCDGQVEIFIEPLDRSYQPALSAYASRDRGSLLTVLPGSDGREGGERAWYHEADGFKAVRGTWPQWLQDEVTDLASRLAKRGGAETIQVAGPDGTVRIFVDGIVPPPRLLVIGSGNDVPPLVRLASRSGFDVTVVGYRDGGVDEADFSDATAVHTTTPRDLYTVTDFDDDTYCVVMTHNFVDDQVTVEKLLETRSPYIGVVSSKGRTENLLEAIRNDTSSRAQIDRDRIYAPIGLDLGGGAPNQIALSIVSEVLAVHNGREPTHLRNQQQPIHDRVD